MVGIGAMNATNAFEAVKAGLDGVAVVSGIVSQKDITAPPERLKLRL